jgi:PHD/YefM family antitoxin component YafN of YafNO toxin-antitoxin module
MYDYARAHVKTVNALAVRRSLGAVLDALERDKTPILVTRDQKAVAALVPLSIFKQRFVDYLAEDALQQALDELRELQSVSAAPDSVVDLQKLRAGE